MRILSVFFDLPRWRYVSAITLALAFFLAANTPTSKASERDPRHYEVWAGTDISQHVWLVYSGTTLAPFSDIHEDGLRLRFVGGYGQYKYVSHSIAHNFRSITFNADTNSADALIGYLKRMGPLTAKAFVGASAINHIIHPVDLQNRAQGLDIGVKGVLEFWLNIGDNAYASLDLAWSQAHNTRSARTRIGYRLMPKLSVGVEAGVNIDRQGEYKIVEEVLSHRNTPLDYARGGAFARFEWFGGEIAVSGGLLGDFTQHKSPYGTVNWITQF